VIFIKDLNSRSSLDVDLRKGSIDTIAFAIRNGLNEDWDGQKSVTSCMLFSLRNNPLN
jgi:hypothetical protein